MQSAAVYDEILKTDSKFVFIEFSISHPLLYNYYGGVCMGSLCCLLIRANKARLGGTINRATNQNELEIELQACELNFGL